MKRVFVFFIGLWHVCIISAQDTIRYDYILPVTIPVLLSGNFGELRPNHFHSGIDFRTQGVEGKPILAIDSGYVSRIMIRPVGYGNALYVNHPNGQTSVYAHLQSFASDIDSFITEYRIAQKMNSVDIPVEPGLLPVRRGEEIAKSGNSGSSGGPHLHFEIRETRRQLALQPFAFYPEITDRAAPRFTSLTVYPLDSLSFVNKREEKQVLSVSQSRPGVYSIQNPISVTGTIGLGIRGFDYMHTVQNVFGYYAVSLVCNDSVLFSRKIDTLSFHETHCFNGIIDYPAFLQSRHYVEKLYTEPNTCVSIYSHTNRGIRVDSIQNQYRCIITAADYHGNTAQLHITLTHDTDTVRRINSRLAQVTNSYANHFIYDSAGFRFFADSNTFFTDFSFGVSIDSSQLLREYSPRYTISSNEWFLKEEAQISIQTRLPAELMSKAVVRFQPPHGGAVSLPLVVGADGVAHVRTKRIGTYSIVVDSIPPVISQESFRNGADLSQRTSIHFHVRDNFSGIADYYAYINGVWTIVEYDAKNARMTIDLQKAPVIPNTRNTLKCIVVDFAGNETKKTYTFYR